ncbi:MAG TPA: lipid A-modifier LpxR family protein [Steroidobacteraceae bacterium]|nr:lipid A-modifier LpxR family protein [Steroidobacteraceae bacterium]
MAPPALAEPESTGASIVLDEHLLTDAKRDMDYNGGGEISWSGIRALRHVRWFDRLLERLDSLSGVGSSTQYTQEHALAAGLLVFTPRDLQLHATAVGDRPYASLFFLSVGRRYVSAAGTVAYNSSFTFGMLGLAAAGGVQDVLHDMTGSIRPEGWSHQISAGGEPTARYGLARQSLLWELADGGWTRADCKWTLAASAGTVTEGSLALNLRWGHLASPWWSIAPEQTMYVQEPQPAPPPLARGAVPEVFALIGARAKLRLYDAFLQGQFRHSDLRYSEGQVNQVLGEAWVGVEFRTASGLELRYFARWQSPELRSGIGSRSIVWGSFEIAKSFVEPDSG